MTDAGGMHPGRCGGGWQRETQVARKESGETGGAGSLQAVCGWKR